MLRQSVEADVVVGAGDARLNGNLRVPEHVTGLVIFAHGSGSGRFSRRNRAVAAMLESDGLATLLLDLLTEDEELLDQQTFEYRFDIDLLGRRVIATVDWAARQADVRALSVGLFGASTGAAAALIASAQRPHEVRAVVSRGGRADLAGDVLPRVQAPTLLIVGSNDDPVIVLNQEAMQRMTAPVELQIVPGATHLFEEPGALENVARLASGWFNRYLLSAP